MSDSNLTKKALAQALKDLINEKPFSKISISDICDRCHMSRKSFYYHFTDKYDLVNRIFDTEFLNIAENSQFRNPSKFFQSLLNYFYENRKFYRVALSIKGQKSFSEHFRELCSYMFMNSLKEIMEDDEISPFHLNFLSDAFICAIERWLLDKNCLPPDEFYKLCESCITKMAKKVCDDTQEL